MNESVENIPVSETVEDCGPDNEKQDVTQDEKHLHMTNVEPSEVKTFVEIENVTEKAPEIEEVN